ncbi:MAG TPA: diadenylate cyclase CdaA [Candidatus Xenobia bacterium]|jgi:diadenylate cyclase
MDLHYWQSYLQVSLRDVIDVLLTWVLLYYFFLLIRGTRAVQILQGVGVLLVISLGAWYFRLGTIYWILRAVLISIAVALPIVFHPELRRALFTLGRGGVKVSSMHRVGREELAHAVDEITWAASVLSQMSTGALVVLERETGLEEYIETGILVNGEVSSKLLLSIFIPRSPLHDGAVIVHGDKVVAASCYLPNSDNIPTGEKLGTRHRAALGLSEQTDAVIVVISEETGSISLAIDGKLSKGYNEETLKRALMNAILPPLQPLTGAGSLLKLPLWR